MSRVLIVDDNADLATTLRDVLASASADDPLDVEIAATGKAALARAKETGFDVALVDVKLPDASGVDLIRPLREASPNSEVVLITGFASMEAAIAALRAGAFAMILKSFRPDELVTTVRQAMTKARMQRERDELERRYRAVVDLTDVIVIALDAQDAVVLFNKKAAELAGVSPEAAVGRNFMRAWIPQGDHGRLEEALALARAGKRAHSDVETGFVATGHDQSRRVRWHLGGTIDSEAGALVYGIGIDVTERRALEKRAADAEALSAMGTLALNLAHEIRNPLNAAKLQLHLLGKKVDKHVDEEATRAAMHRRVGIVGDGIARLNRLLTEFLELARPRGIAREPVHVGELVDSVLSLERESAEARGVRVVRDVAHGVVAIGDAEKLRQVVLNLVVNALEAMKDGGVLTVRAVADGERIALSIEDTGPGIPAEVRAQVFNPFFTTKEAGTGLGLSIVRKIIDQHAGDVRLESEVGKGTTVRVWNPERPLRSRYDERMRASSFFSLLLVACSTDTFVGGDGSTSNDGGGGGDVFLVDAAPCVPSFCGSDKGATTCNDFDESNQPQQWSTDTSAGTIDTTSSAATSCPNAMRVVFPSMTAPTGGLEPHAYAIAQLGNPQDVTATFDAILPDFPAADGGDVDGFVVAALRATLDGSWAARVERSADGAWYLRLRETGGANPASAPLANMLTGAWNHMQLTVHYAADNTGSASLTYQTTPNGQTTTMSLNDHPTLPAAGAEVATFAVGAGALSATSQPYTFLYDSVVIQAN